MDGHVELIPLGQSGQFIRVPGLGIDDVDGQIAQRADPSGAPRVGHAVRRERLLEVGFVGDLRMVLAVPVHRGDDREAAMEGHRPQPADHGNDLPGTLHVEPPIGHHEVVLGIHIPE